MSALVIAVDGPSGSGKSSVSREVAKRLGLQYLDTGAMYRALTWYCLTHGIEDPVAIARASRDFDLRMGTDPSAPSVAVGEHRIDDEIRSSRVSGAVSAVATNLDVRADMKARQRALIEAAAQGIVAEGRDITTVVAPDADVRLLLTADPAAREARRANQTPDQADDLAARDAKDATVSQFHTAADGVTTLDSTNLDFEQTVQTVLDRIAAEQQALDRTAALRAGLAEYELDDEDLAVLESGPVDGEGAVELELPVVAVVGRPNVGKSSLVNRILGRREAVVEDVPGVTRDRVRYTTEWSGTPFVLMDTGGWDTDVVGLTKSVAVQAEIAIELADVVLFVVDATVGATDSDEAVVKLLRRAKKPVILAANKVDDERGEADAAMLWSLGLGEPHPVSALHGRGSGDLLDVVLDVLPPAKPKEALLGDYPRRVALLGRPNVGKSSLLNKMLGENRVVVDDVAGTTRDPVDELVELGGRLWTFVDTAGIRRRVAQSRGADFYAVLRTQSALEKAEVAVVLIDAGDVLSEQDTRIIGLVVEAGRALVLAINKWDLVDEDRRRYLEREIEQDLAHVKWAPRVNISARTGRHTEKLVPALDVALESWDTRVPTAALNQFITELVNAHPHPVRSGKQPRILFITQASTRPPRFVIFASGFLEAQYRRFIERRLREEFGFEGSPIELSVRVREKRRR